MTRSCRAPGARAAVSVCGRSIGIPGEDVGTIRDAGMVQFLGSCGLAPRVSGGAISQNSPGIPGMNEPGDRFGAAVAQYSLPDEPSGAPVIGVPGEDVGSITDAGVIVGRYALSSEGWYSYRQGAGLAGAAEAGDAVGVTLGVRHFYEEGPIRVELPARRRTW